MATAAHVHRLDRLGCAVARVTKADLPDQTSHVVHRIQYRFGQCLGLFTSANISRRTSAAVTIPPRGVRKSWLTRQAIVSRSPRKRAFSSSMRDSLVLIAPISFLKSNVNDTSRANRRFSGK